MERPWYYISQYRPALVCASPLTCIMGAERNKQNSCFHCWDEVGPISVYM